MASDFSVRSFLSGDLLWGVKQSDPLGTVHYQKRNLFVKRKPLLGKPKSRFLSEQPSTYLR